MRRLEPRERRLAAIALLLAVVALAWLAVVRPLVTGFVDRAERRRDLLLAYARDERLLAQLPSLGRAAAAQRRSAATFHILATDAPAASAMLGERLSGSAAAAGVSIRAIEELAAPPGIVRARVQASGTLAQAVRFVALVRDGRPLLALDGLAIVAHDDADQPRSGQLDISLAVSASLSAPATR